MLQLYYSPRTVAAAVAITLEEVGTPYELVRVDFGAAEQTTPAYHRINPKGRVPALVTPDGILTETPAVLEYVGPGLVPADAYAATRMRELMAYLNGTMHPNHAHGLRGARWADEERSFADMKQKVPQTMANSAAYVEAFLADLPFPVGEMAVVSDAYLYVVLSWLDGDGVDIAEYPRLQAFQAKMAQRPAIRAVHDIGVM